MTQYKAKIEQAEPNPFVDELLLRVIILAKRSDQRRFRHAFRCYVSGTDRPTFQEVIQIAMNKYTHYLEKEEYIGSVTGKFTFEVDDDFQISGIIKQDE